MCFGMIDKRDIPPERLSKKVIIFRNRAFYLLFLHLCILLAETALVTVRRAWLAAIMNVVYILVIVLGWVSFCFLNLRLARTFWVVMYVLLSIALAVLFYEAFALSKEDKRHWVFIVNVMICFDIMFTICYTVAEVKLRKEMIVEIDVQAAE